MEDKVRNRPASPKERKTASPDPTPWKDKLNVEYLKHTLIRKHIRGEMGSEILECPVNAFLTDYSPFLPNDALVDAAIQVLAEKQLLVTDEHGEPLFWRDFEDEPSSGGMETQVFQPLEDIAAALDDELGQLDGRRRHFFYRDCPYDDMKSEIPGSNFRVDACFTDNSDHSRNKHVICAETAVVAEFKKFTKDIEDNREKLVSAASHIMNDDPCRMWMYGITIENTKMAVWYFSRSHSVKTQTFDFTKDFRMFIRIFLSFTYATREQMGYDPTIHRIKDKGLQYVYEIPTQNGTRYFKTIQLLAHRRVLCITGRKTRVWKAVEVRGFEGDAINEELNGGKEVALKDIWLDDGSKTEKQKLEAIFERLRTIEEEAYKWAPSSLRSKLKAAFKNEGYKDYFMEIVCDSFDLGKSKKKSDQAVPAPEILRFGVGDIENLKKGTGSHEDGIGGAGVHVSNDIRNATFVEDQNMLEDSTQTPGYSLISEGALVEAAISPLTVKTRLYKDKRQYCLVYGEVGESIDRVESLDVSFSAVLDVYVALVLMYLAGWMHRDISAGNIIAVKRENGQFGGKLSDLEYAKHSRDKSASSDPKTGTHFFMPMEIHAGMRFIRQDRLKLEVPDDIDPFSNPRIPRRSLKYTGPLFTETPPQYRFQHDLESLWWVALWILIYRVVHPPGREISEKIFTRTSVPSLARRQIFEGRRVGQILEQYLHPSLDNGDIKQSMEVIQSMLLDSYLNEESSEPQAMHMIYSNFFLFLAILVVAARSVEGVILQPRVVVKPKKRPHSEAAVVPKGGDADEYEVGEEETSSDGAVPKKKRKAQT